MTSLPLPSLPAVFVAGLISFLSPCVLPLVPGYVSLISGVGVEQLKLKEAQLFRKVMFNSAAFIIGFSIVFITLGAISTEVGQILVQYKSLLARIAGGVIILFGLHLTGILPIKALLADTRLHSLKVEQSGDRAILTAAVPPGFIRKALSEAPPSTVMPAAPAPPPKEPLAPKRSQKPGSR